jgi:hypothetical protein
MLYFTNEPREFICTDCGRLIISFDLEPHPDIDLCATCRWIREVVPPDQQRAVRERLGVPLIKVPP